MKFLLVAAAACAALAITSVAPAAAPTIPLQATYSGKNSHGKVAKVTVSKQGKRVGYTMYVNLPCNNNGGNVPGIYWTTEGKFNKDYWIRPRPNGTFSLASSNTAKWNKGTFKARAQFAGRFVTSSVVSGTFRGHIDYYDTAGKLLYRCDTGGVTWTAKR
jgi:hypothetical protein